MVVQVILNCKAGGLRCRSGTRREPGWNPPRPWIARGCAMLTECVAALSAVFQMSARVFSVYFIYA